MFFFFLRKWRRKFEDRIKKYSETRPCSFIIMSFFIDHLYRSDIYIISNKIICIQKWRSSRLSDIFFQKTASQNEMTNSYSCICKDSQNKKVVSSIRPNFQDHITRSIINTVTLYFFPPKRKDMLTSFNFQNGWKFQSLKPRNKNHSSTVTSILIAPCRWMFFFNIYKISCIEKYSMINDINCKR